MAIGLTGLASVEIIGVELWKAWIFTHLGGIIAGVGFIAAGSKSGKKVESKTETETD